MSDIFIEDFILNDKIKCNFLFQYILIANTQFFMNVWLNVKWTELHHLIQTHINSLLKLNAVAGRISACRQEWLPLCVHVSTSMAGDPRKLSDPCEPKTDTVIDYTVFRI
jgi:hypothetical protein